MALTLVEMRKQTQDPVRAGVIEIFGRNSFVLANIPLKSTLGTAYQYLQEGELPGVAFRGINGSYSESTGVINPQVEPLKVAGGDCKVDEALIKMNGGGGAGLLADQIRMKSKALSLLIEDAIFNGDSASDPLLFDGLGARLTGTQKIAMGSTSGGDTLTLAKLDETIDAVNSPTHIICNRTMRRKINALVRATNSAMEMVDGGFGRQVPAYAGLPILVTGEDRTGAEILAFDEADNGGGSDVCTSIYVVRFDADDGVCLLQNPAGIDVRALGEVQTQPQRLTRIEWIVGGPAIFQGRAAARLWAIKTG